MKIRLASIVSVLLVSLAAAVGCGGSGGEKLTIGGDVPEITQDATLVDLEVIRADPGLLAEADEVLGALNRSLGNAGVGSSDVRSAVSFVINGRRVLMVEGSFETDDVAKRLEGSGHAVRHIGEAEVWSGDAGNVALLGPGRMALSYDFRTTERVIVQLEEGVTLDRSEAARAVLDGMSGNAYISFTARCESIAPGCEALGFSASGGEGPSGSFDLVSYHETPESAIQAQPVLEGFAALESLFRDVTVSTEDRMFIASGEGDLAEIFRGAESDFRLIP